MAQNLNRTRKNGMFCALTGAIVGGLFANVPAQADFPFQGIVTPPALDRWMYPFGPSGARATASVFTTIGSSIGGFDDRDAEYLLGFDTGALVPKGYPARSYRVHLMSVSARVHVDDGVIGVVFDPTSDLAATYLPIDDDDRIDDADAGRPVEMFACAYRGNHPTTGQPWGPMNYVQSSPFATLPPIGNGRGNRAVYPIDYDAANEGAARDVSINVTGTPRFDPTPLSVGQAYANGQPVAPGAIVNNGDEFVFLASLSATGVREYVQEAMSLGRLNLLITAMHPASDFGSGPVTYPIFSTRFDPFSTAARLQLVVTLCPADIADDQGNPHPGMEGVPNTGINEGDYNAFFQGFFDAMPQCDIADDQGNIIGTAAGVPNSGVNEGDYNMFFQQFFLGCG